MSSLRALPRSPPSRLPLGLSALHELEATSSEWSSKGGYSPQDETLASVLGLPEVVLGCEGWMRGGVLSETDPLSLRPLFLNQELSAAGVWQGRPRARHSGGLARLLEKLFKSEDDVPVWVMTLWNAALSSARWVHSLHGAVFPHLTLSRDDMVATFSQAVDCDVVPTLKHGLQKGVAALAWKPLSASGLAVACRSCVLVWTVDPSSLSTRPSAVCAQVLSCPGSGPVTALAWAPQGHLLLSASPAHTTITVWDVATESCASVPCPGGGGVSLLVWAPSGGRVLAATPSPMFRVFETRTWTCEKWPTMAGRCQAACWGPGGTHLLFAVQGEPLIYGLTFSTAADCTESTVGGAQAASVCVDLSSIDMQTADETSITLGGEVQSMVWDPCGERLAVLIIGVHSCLAVFKTRLHPVFELLPCGFVQGEEGATPQLMAFHPSFRQGALLSVGWSNGHVSYIPFYFARCENPLHCGAAAATIEPSRSLGLFSEL
ncbi:aladin isoform X2 [Petromyzon marinus]|uniref:Aladin isoform X2 n=1 Tax=Petromyzon marinus TaxID=7757 RepID=A0AAJ7TAB7_PETMA|nr:aladin isoform X2 [Petromyzon marinus]